ncbi:hypothetical protein GCM10023195_58450 [Actinoallomurus liliacearum]|uniref:GerMN domain-containing protein n=1 Tax=Actinoallomurus liliacearum TaxID=1080073 RepID=A0ABP8TUX5_9ACTN
MYGTQNTPETATVRITGREMVKDTEVAFTLTVRSEELQTPTDEELLELLVNMTRAATSKDVRLTSLQHEGRELLPENEVEVHDGRPVIELDGRMSLDGIELAVTIVLSFEEPEAITADELAMLVPVATNGTEAWGLQLTSFRYHGEELLPQTS